MTLRKAVLFLLATLFLIPSVFAAQIMVNVPQVIQGNSATVFYNQQPRGSLFSAMTELENTGTVGYAARIRMDVYNESKQIFTAWSGESNMLPGDDRIFGTDYYSNTPGNFTAIFRAYFGNEITNLRNVSLVIDATPNTSDIFTITDFRTYDDHVQFYLHSNQNVANISIIPSGYPISWIFEETQLARLDSPQIRKIILPFVAEPWSSTNVTVTVVGDNGKFVTTKTFNLQKESGLLLYLNELKDWLKEIVYNIH